MNPLLAAVALPVAVSRAYVYSVPESLRTRVVPGSRVVVPLGGRTLIGIVTAIDVPAPVKGRLRDILDAPDAGRTLTPELLTLGRWMARYYAAPPGIVLRAMLPVALTGAAGPVAPVKRHRVACVVRTIESLLERDAMFKRAPRQRVLYELLESLGGSHPVRALLEQADVTAAVLHALVTRELVAIESTVVARGPFSTRGIRAAVTHVPTDAQRHAIAKLIALEPGAGALLRGVTGSGKTLVYIEYLRDVIERRGQGAIVLVPEIALTPQTVDRFRTAFGDQVAVLHSALSDGERYDEWSAIHRGDKRIVVGARSAIFAPVKLLGAIVVDEEHEATYKQGESPRYHARDLARVRAGIEGATFVLGSASPSLESWTQALRGDLALLELPERAGGAQLPAVHVIDRRKEVIVRRQVSNTPGAPSAQGSSFAHAITPQLEHAITERLNKGEQSILLLNRRGYAHFMQCADCGAVSQCPNCAIALTYHRMPERLACHYCFHREAPPSRCSNCSGPPLRERGLGTQQLERLLGERWPAARIARMDMDTTGAKWAHATILDKVGAGEVDILLGTQMIAKGLDFPNVTLVGVIDADVGINLPDFRASERCFQLLSQVAGRAGRGAKGGEVFIQTREPTHHAVTCAVTHDFLRFAAEELSGRISPAYPPSLFIANAVISGTEEIPTADAARALAEWTRRLIDTRMPGAVEVVGAAPCPVERIKQRWRWHFLVKSRETDALGRIGRYVVEHGPLPSGAAMRLAWDRDPVTLL
ncbi:MAG: primosomal protein N' [Gemmatimonadaceae bacterium]|nr:primosomal protein N' [Gemmatimonadaceae bacterium]